MTCYWIENGIEIEGPGDVKSSSEILETIAKIRKRAKPKFDF
jgi:hypothetical protein